MGPRTASTSKATVRAEKLMQNPPRILRKDAEAALRRQRAAWAAERKVEKEAKEQKSRTEERRSVLRIRHLQGKPLSRTDVTRAIREGFGHAPGVPLSVLCVSESHEHFGQRTGDERALFAGALAADIIDEMESAEWLAVAQGSDKERVLALPPSSEGTPRVGVEVTLQGGGADGLMGQLVSQQVQPGGDGDGDGDGDGNNHGGTFGRIYAVPSSELTALYTSRRVLAGELNVNEAERLSLRLAWEQLLSSEGSEVYVKPAPLYVNEGEGVSFRTIERMARRRGEIAIGVVRGTDGAPWLNPSDKDAVLVMEKNDAVIVIARDSGGLSLLAKA